MKIYNKRKFYFSICLLLLAVSDFVLNVIQNSFDMNGSYVILCCAILGLHGCRRSLSKKMSQEDKIEKLDERNQWIELKSKRTAFQIMQYLLFGVGILFAMLGGFYKSVSFGIVAVTSTLILIATLLLDLVTYIYYEIKH